MLLLYLCICEKHKSLIQLQLKYQKKRNYTYIGSAEICAVSRFIQIALVSQRRKLGTSRISQNRQKYNNSLSVWSVAWSSTTNRNWIFTAYRFSFNRLLKPNKWLWGFKQYIYWRQIKTNQAILKNLNNSCNRHKGTHSRSG